MDVGGFQQIFAAADMGDGLIRIVDDDCEVIGDADVLAGENGIAIEVRIHRNFPKTQILKREFLVEFMCFVGMKAPRMGFACSDAFGGSVFGKISAGAGVEMFRSSVWGAETLSDVLTRAEAGINKIVVLQGSERIAIGVLSAALTQRFSIPVEPEPAEIFLDLLVVGFADA